MKKKREKKKEKTRIRKKSAKINSLHFHARAPDIELYRFPVVC